MQVCPPRKLKRGRRIQRGQEISQMRREDDIARSDPVVGPKGRGEVPPVLISAE